MTFDLKEKNIIITGGYGYLGAVMSKGLLQHNANVFVLGKSQSKYDAVFNDVENVFFQECDVANSNAIKIAFENVYKICGSIDVLINNAFYLEGQNPLAISDDQWAYSMDGVLGNIYKCIREIVPIFEKNKGGKIINISSMYGLQSPDFKIYEDSPEMLNPPHYGVGKAGVIQMTKYFANYLANKNIHVNTISPGPFPSKEVAKNTSFIKALVDKVPLSRVGNPEDLIGPVVFLSSAASDYITGHNLIVDGGMTVW